MISPLETIDRRGEESSITLLFTWLICSFLNNVRWGSLPLVRFWRDQLVGRIRCGRELCTRMLLCPLEMMAAVGVLSVRMVVSFLKPSSETALKTSPRQANVRMRIISICFMVEKFIVYFSGISSRALRRRFQNGSIVGMKQRSVVV